MSIRVNAFPKYLYQYKLSIRRFFLFTPYNPESPGLQIGDEGNFKSKDKEKLRPLGRGFTGFT